MICGVRIEYQFVSEGLNGDVTSSPRVVGAASCIPPGFEVPFRWL